MVDNFDAIRTMLDFSNDNFYFIQIIKRRKENPDMLRGERHVRSYYVSNMDYFNNIKDEIKSLCIMYNARAYIYVTPRSKKKVAMSTLKMVVDSITNESYDSLNKLYDSAAGSTPLAPKYWLVDLDTKNNELIDDALHCISQCDSGYSNIIVKIVPTINGVHIITRAFNLQQFKDKFKEYDTTDIHKDANTLLFYQK